MASTTTCTWCDVRRGDGGNHVISASHRTYLALGGQGFLLGDGRLRYGREHIVEAYYTAQAFRGVFPSLDLQVIDHPGYNRDRGPVAVASARLYVEL